MTSALHAVDNDLQGSVDERVEAAYRAREAWRRRPSGETPEGSHRLLLEHVRATVPFYRDRRDDELPVVDRSLYVSAPNEFRSTLELDSPYRLTSSGTWGEPLTIGVDEAAWYAINYHFFEQIRELADLPKHVFRRARPGVLFVSNKPTGRTAVRPLPSLDDALYVRLQLGAGAARVSTAYERLRAPILYGKPTYLVDLRAALIAAGASPAPWSPRLLLVSGEPLHGDDRERLTSFFGAPLVDALASTEGGLVAATPPDERAYVVFGDNVRLEVATDAEIGASGTGELVLTSLVHRGTVFVRYRTGDRANLRTGPDGRQRLLRLWGREPSTVRLPSVEISADALTAALGPIEGVGDFRLLYGDAPPIVLCWAPEPLCEDEHAVEGRLRGRLRELLPAEEVVVERRARITPLGGKKLRFVRSSEVGEER